MFLNPAGLADVAEPQLSLGTSYDSLSQWFSRTNEPRTDLGRSFGSVGLAVGTPLPGPWWLRRLRLGFALDLPATYVLSVDIPSQTDQPVSPIYDARPNRPSVILGGAIDVIDQLKLGGGVSLTPSLTLPTSATLVPGRSNSVQNDVVVDLDRSMPLGAAPFLGVRSQVVRWLSLALVYRGEGVSHAQGPASTVAGPITFNANLDYLIFWDPAAVVGGVELGPWKGLSLSVDVAYNEWSDFRTFFDQLPSPAFHDTVSVMAGLEWTTLQWLTFRAGGGYEPSPIPPQTGDTNYLGAGTTVLSGGAGVDLRRLCRAPLLVDVHVRGRFGAEESVTKDAASLTSAGAPGLEIANYGYPGFQSRSSLFQTGITLTLFVGKDKK
jgi:hypothetical protein